MARQQVMQVQCDRCKRVNLQPVVEDKKVPDFDAVFQNRKLTYHDLCESCISAVNTSWQILAEWDREVKQKLLGPTVSDNQAPPLDVAPDYTPPKPHSAAGAKRS